MKRKNSRPDWAGTAVLRGAHRQVHDRAKGVAIYWYARRGKGAPLLAVYRGATLAEARDKEDADFRGLLDAYDKERLPKVSTGLIARVVAEYRADPAFTTLKPATQKTYRVWLNKIEDKFGGFAEHELTDDAVSAWLKEIYTAHGARARDHALRILSRLASWGRHPERKHFRPSFEPTKGFETLYRAPPQPTWEPADVERIAQIPHPEVRWALMLALNTGLRRADLVSLPWSAVDERAGYIRWLTSKGSRYHRRVNIPITPALRSLLQIIPKRSPIILTSRWERPWTVNGLSHAITEELQKAKISGTLHGLRRYAATNWAALGWSSRKIAKVMGWSESEAEAMGAIYIDEEREAKLWVVSQMAKQPTD